MNRIFRTLLTAVASIALALGFAVSPANAVPSPSTLYAGGPAGSTPVCTGPVELYSDSAHTLPVTSITGGGSASFQNDCPTQAVHLEFGSSTSQVSGSSFIAGGIARNTTSLMFTASGTFSMYLCAPAGNPGSTANCPNAGTRVLAVAIPLTVSGGGSNSNTPVTPRGPSTSAPSASATPAATASATPAAGSAEALAAKPKSATQPKLSFDSSSNGLGKASKKSLKKVAEVAKDGYGVRVTGAAGMQPGVSKDVVKALAKKRAMEIRAYLIKQGVPKEDIIIKTKIFPIGKAPATLVKVETLS